MTEAARREIVITDETGQPVGARMLLFDHGGEPVRIGVRDAAGEMRQARGYCHLGDGAVGTWDGILIPYGRAELSTGVDYCEEGIPTLVGGRYRAMIWRGIEFEIANLELELGDDQPVGFEVVLDRVFDPGRTLAADLHVHAAASDDSRVPNEIRLMAQVSAGVQVIGVSDHNTNGDFAAEIDGLGLTSVVASVASNELSNRAGHLGADPVHVALGEERGGAPSLAEINSLDIEELMALARGLGDDPIVQVNHPRFRYRALFDDFSWDGLSWPPPFPLDFDAVEVLSGHTAFNTAGDRRLDDSLRDFYTFIRHGVLITALGNSDTHHLNGVLDATTRSYVYVEDTALDPLDERGFIAAIRGRRALATTGPWLEVKVRATAEAAESAGPGGAIQIGTGVAWIEVVLYQASFVHTERVRILVGGDVVEEIAVVPGARVMTWSGELAVGGQDTWIGVDASGDEALPVELTGTYHLENGREGVTPMALINPILVDADGDGSVRFGSANVPVDL
jgi:hypothetical protein